MKGNERFRRYLTASLFTTVWNLVELYLIVARSFGGEEARRQFARFRDFAVDTPDDLLREAMDLKLSKPKLSYTDAIGYAASQHLSARFLTGDPAFRRMAGVEFRT